VAVAFKRLAPFAFLAAFPILALAVAAEVALRAGSLGLDFRAELYPEARFVLHGVNRSRDKTTC